MFTEVHGIYFYNYTQCMILLLLCTHNIKRLWENEAKPTNPVIFDGVKLLSNSETYSTFSQNIDFGDFDTAILLMPLLHLSTWENDKQLIILILTNTSVKNLQNI